MPLEGKIGSEERKCEEKRIIKCLLYIPSEEESAITFTQCREGGGIVSISFLLFSPSSNLPVMFLFSGGERTQAPSLPSSPGGICGCKQRRRRKGALLAAQTFIRRGREKKGFCRRSNTERERKGFVPLPTPLVWSVVCSNVCTSNLLPFSTTAHSVATFTPAHSSKNISQYDKSQAIGLQTASPPPLIFPKM